MMGRALNRVPRVSATLLLALVGACGDGGDGGPAGDATGERIALPAPIAHAHAPASEIGIDDFAGAESCAECHPSQYDSWAGSTHGRAGGEPGPDVVIAPFDGRPIRFADATVVPERRDGDYVFRVRREGEPDQVLEVSGAVGGGHMVGGGTQGFLMDMPDGTVRFLPFDWSRDEATWFCNTGTRAEKGWVRIDSSMRLADCGDWPPTRVFGHTDRFGNCQECHGSQVEIGWDAERRAYASTRADLRIDCESCHGPARAHIAAARDAGRAGEGAAAGSSGGGLAIRSLVTLDTDASLQVCFRCHALKDALEPGYLPGRGLEKHYALKFPILGDEPYFPDGRVRTFAYQGNHLYSDCFVSGSMTCTDCHAPHSNDYQDVWKRTLDNRFDDGQCLACHAAKADAIAEHTRHPVGSEGSRCVACHMPYLQHPELGQDIRFSRSDHVIAIPRPAFDDSLGLTSACAACHTDRSTAELQAATDRWWGPIKPHHPLVAGLLRAREMEDRAEAADQLLRPDLDHPIAQFAALAHLLEEHLGPDMTALEPDITARLTELASADDLDVRALALAALHYAAGEAPGVRRTLADALRADSSTALRRRWALAIGFMADRERDAGRIAPALAAYWKALEVSPDDPRILAAMGLAYRQGGQPDRAVTTLRRALELDPLLPLARVNLGIALQEAGRPADAAQVLSDAVDATPFEPMAHFSLGNLLLRAGRSADAERAYERTVQLDPGLALAWFYLARTRIEQQDYDGALPAARRAVEFDPGNDGARQMLADLERVVGNTSPGRR